MSSANHVTTDQDWQDESTVYWFDLDGERYGIVEQGPETFPVDADGCRIDYNETLAARVRGECVVTDEMRADAAGF